MRHLTFTGFYAGKPICGSPTKTEQDAHAVYAPMDNPEFRATCCTACLKVYAEGYLDEDGEVDMDAPAWVRELV